MGLSVTGVYALCAFGDFRSAAFVNLGSRGILLVLMAVLVRHGGVTGLAVCRVIYGAAALAVYAPLMRRMGSVAASSVTSVGQEQEAFPL